MATAALAARLTSSSLAGALHSEPGLYQRGGGRKALAGYLLPFNTPGGGAARKAKRYRKEVAALRAILADRPNAERARSVKELARELAERTANMGQTTTILESTAEHRAWVTAGCVALGALAAKGLLAVHSPEEGVAVAAAGLGAYLLADLGTGVYHWAVDNYGDANTPVFGAQIDAFQGHHQRPWTITKRQFANNLHALCRSGAFFTLPFLALPSHASADVFFAVFIACAVFSQQFHAWAHCKKSQLPAPVLALQDAGLLVSRKAHGLHHRPPYHSHYCIVSGACNPLLDSTRFFPRLERTIFNIWSIAPRCWSETSQEWLEVAYYEEDAQEVQR